MINPVPVTPVPTTSGALHTPPSPRTPQQHLQLSQDNVWFLVKETEVLNAYTLQICPLPDFYLEKKKSACFRIEVPSERRKLQFLVASQVPLRPPPPHINL